MHKIETNRNPQAARSLSLFDYLYAITEQRKGRSDETPVALHARTFSVSWLCFLRGGRGEVLFGRRASHDKKILFRPPGRGRKRRLFMLRIDQIGVQKEERKRGVLFSRKRQGTEWKNGGERGFSFLNFFLFQPRRKKDESLTQLRQQETKRKKEKLPASPVTELLLIPPDKKK